MLRFLTRPKYMWLSLMLLTEVAAFYAYPKAEIRPLGQPLAAVPKHWNGWGMVRESELDTDVADLLRADETLHRYYSKPGQTSVGLFIAFYKSQRTGISPHSPKVCLPGSGWVPLENRLLEIPVSGWSSPTIEVNRFIVGKGNSRSVVLYWYETPFRVIANEYKAKVFTVLDGLRHHRSDTSIVRVIVGTEAEGLKEAEETAVRFVQDFFPNIREHLPAR